ncbi:hypothetical protein KCP91_16295 [Microvirga sp. SRT01]|nr:hypothetical protein [Microvirga sp. SRT01]
MITHHAQTRMQQRAIPALALELFERFASSMRHNGADVLFFDKAARKRITKAFGGQRACRIIEPWLGTYVVSENGAVVTVAHRTRRLKRDH